MGRESQEIEQKLKHLGKKLREIAEQKHALTANDCDMMRMAIREQWHEQQREVEKRKSQERDQGPEL